MIEYVHGPVAQWTKAARNLKEKVVRGGVPVALRVAFSFDELVSAKAKMCIDPYKRRTFSDKIRTWSGSSMDRAAPS